LDDFLEELPEPLFVEELDFVEPDFAAVLEAGLLAVFPNEADLLALLPSDFAEEADLPAVLPPPGFAALDLLAVEPDLADVLAVDLPAEDDFPAELDLLEEADFPAEPDLPAEVVFPVVLDAGLAEPLLEEAADLEEPPDVLPPDDLPEASAPAFFMAVSAAPLTAPFAAPLPTSEIAFAACAATLPRVSPTVAAIPLSEPFLPFDDAGFFVAVVLAVDFFSAAFFAIVSLPFNLL
jgi:hypothetical protein